MSYFSGAASHHVAAIQGNVGENPMVKRDFYKFLAIHGNVSQELN